MNFAELQQEVYSITNRPDRVAETISAIKASTLQAHHTDYYYKDLFECGVAFDEPDYLQTLFYRELIPRYRAIKYLRKYDPVSTTPGTILNLVVPENVLDSYACAKQDIYYVAGAAIQLNSCTLQQYYLLGCYVHPDITQTGFDSWIALDHPYAIVYAAAAMVFKAIGKDEEAATYSKLVAGELAMLNSSNVVANGF